MWLFHKRVPAITVGFLLPFFCGSTVPIRSPTLSLVAHFEFRSGLFWSKTLFVGLLAEAPMWRIRFAMLVMAFTAATWSTCQAIGSFQTRPAFPKVVMAGVASPVATVRLPGVSGRDLVGGCGGHSRGHQTHGCRGPDAR